MKKKIINVLLVAAMAVSMVAGCGSKNDSKKILTANLARRH